MAMELGAFSPFLWLMKARDLIYDLMEEETGQHIMYTAVRVGGMAYAPSSSFKENARAVVAFGLQTVEEVERLLLTNRIFLDRLEGIGKISGKDAMSLGWTGPCLRASGVPYDVRRAHPYLRYADVDFEVPIGTEGDCLDRFVIRFAEVRQSARIILQCLERLPDQGLMNIADPRIVLPPKREVYETIEGTIQHFKIVMEGIRLPAGEVYGYTEGGNGELLLPGE